MALNLKGWRARRLAKKALSAFDSAKSALTKAVKFLEAEERKHSKAAIDHAASADAARTTRERHARVRDRIEELLS